MIMPINDPNQFSPETTSSPARNAVTVTPSDTADLTSVSKALYVGVSGDVTVNTLGGATAVTFKAVPAGMILPVRCTRVLATGTTATSIVALF